MVATNIWKFCITYEHAENKPRTPVSTFTSHYCDVIMGTIASQITSLMIVYSIVHSSADQRKHQSSASLAFVRGIHRGPVNSPHRWPVMRKMLPLDDVIMAFWCSMSAWSAVNYSHSEASPLALAAVKIFTFIYQPSLCHRAQIQRSLWQIMIPGCHANMTTNHRQISMFFDIMV